MELKSLNKAQRSYTLTFIQNIHMKNECKTTLHID